MSTSNSFDNVSSAERLPQLGILDRPNDLLIGANVRETSEQIGSDLTYRASRYTSVGIGGSFSNVIYRTIAEQAGAVNENLRSQAWSTHTFVSHRISSIYSMGVNYSAQNFSSQQAFASTLTHSALGFMTISLTSQVHLSVFAGPEVSNIENAASSGSSFLSDCAVTLSFGSTFNWQGERNGLAAGFVQRVNNSIESSSAAVRARTVTFRADRQLTKRTSMNLFANYASNAPLGSSSAVLAPDSITGGIGITRPLTPSISLGVSAFHQEFLSAVSDVFGPTKHNVVSGSISYSFARPIGR